jgi:hypothetical protein
MNVLFITKPNFVYHTRRIKLCREVFEADLIVSDGVIVKHRKGLVGKSVKGLVVVWDDRKIPK